MAVVYEMFQHPASCQVAGPTQTMHGQTMPVCTCGLTDALITLEADRTRDKERIGEMWRELEALRYQLGRIRALLGEVPDGE